MDFVETICDRILIIRKGEIISHETVKSLKEKFAGKHFLIQLDNKPASSLVSDIATLGTAFSKGNSLRVELKDLDNLLPMMQLLRNASAKVVNFQSVEKDLEDIFLEVIRGEAE